MQSATGSKQRELDTYHKDGEGSLVVMVAGSHKVGVADWTAVASHADIMRLAVFARGEGASIKVSVAALRRCEPLPVSEYEPPDKHARAHVAQWLKARSALPVLASERRPSACPLPLPFMQALPP